MSEVTAIMDISRTRRVMQQAGLGLASRVGAIAATFAATPTMLHLLGARQLGVWLVLLSVFQWITLFDLGVAAGARNEIARAVAARDHKRVCRAISTGWVYVAAISMALFIIAAIILTIVPAREWLTIRVFGGVDAWAALWVVTAGACLSFATGYIQSVYAALEKASAFSLFSLVSNVMFVVFLGIAELFSLNKIAEIAMLYLAAIMVANIYLIIRFIMQFPEYRPRMSAVDHKLRRNILNFGMRLFFIQVAALVIFTTSRLMASMFLGPQSVVVYDAGFKVFSLVTIVHSLVMSTLWSSFTQAYERNEMAWIRTSIIRLIQAMIPLSIVCGILSKISPWFIGKWLGEAQVGSIYVYILFAVITILSCWSNIFAYFLNGIGNTRIQLISAAISGVLNIPATYFFTVTMNLGVAGILVGTVISLSFFSIIGPIQVFRLLKKHAYE